MSHFGIQTFCLDFGLSPAVSQFVIQQHKSRDHSHAIGENQSRTVFKKAIDQPHGNANKEH